jgi:hypothetical protein
MQQANPSGQVGGAVQGKNVEDEKKKLDDDLKQGKITQAEYFKKMQELGVTPNPPGGPGSPSPPQLPPAAPSATGGVKPVSPITPITPVTPQQAGPKEEIPPIGQALAIGSEDIEVVECYKCGGLITVTTQQRPVIIACPTCGTKGEVTAEELELPEDLAAGPPKPTEAVEVDEGKIFKFGAEDKPAGPTFGSSLDEDIAKQDKKENTKSSETPPPKPSPTPTPSPTTTPQAQQPARPEDKDKKPK